MDTILIGRPSVVASNWKSTAQALGRLSDEQQRLVASCLQAIVRGPYLDDDDEFHAVMGVTRQQAAEVAETWPEPAANDLSFLTVNNALNNLLGYPHRQWRQLSRELGAGEREVAQALLSWRSDTYREEGGRGNFDSMQ
jgi:hypothetical protein